MEVLDFMAKRIKISKEEHKITFNEALAEYMDYKAASGLTDQSLEQYSFSIGMFSTYNEFDDDTLLEVVDAKMINKYKNHLLKKDISFRTVNSYIRGLRTFLNWCAKRNYIEQLEVKEVKGQETRIKYYTPEEMEKLLEKPTGSNNFGAWRMWAIIAFIYATGARAQSVCNVKMEDVDFYRKEITFTHQKNKSLLVLPLSEQLEKVLKEYIRKCGLKNEEYLFPTITGEENTVPAIQRAMVRYCKTRDVPNRGIHALRHSFASQYIRNGGNPVKLQKILNHSSFSMTERYLHLFGEDLKVSYSDFSPLDTATRKKSRTKRVGNKE